MKTTSRTSSITRQHWLTALVLITLLAAGLRLFRLDHSPLRGDEAFTVRYWAASLPDVLNLARIEPHPLGAFFAFGLWKALAGDSEFAMRTLPALLNLIGIPAIAGLARRLFRRRDAGLIAALLWALNPFLIWHSQDVRNYAIWAALSVLAFYTLVRAAERDRPRAWLVYIICAAVALYTFYFELFFTLLGGVYILLRRRDPSLKNELVLIKGLIRIKTRSRWFLANVVLAILLIPWLIQGYALAASGYRGAAGGVKLPDLWGKWLPILFMGESVPPFFNLWPLLLILLIIAFIMAWVRARRIALFLMLYLVVPVLLVTLASTRMNVFLPRYVIAVLPALLLPVALLFASIWRDRLGKLAIIVFAIFCIGIPLQEYGSGRVHKAPDWFALRDYLRAHTRPGDVILLNTPDPTAATTDPAFDYYYAPTDQTVVVLPNPKITDVQAFITGLSARPASLWYIPSGAYSGEIDAQLREHYHPISDRGVGRGWIVREFRPPQVWQGEITTPLQAEVRGARLNGYHIDQTENELTVLLYWQTPPAFTISVQLIGAPNPANNGSPLWSQSDHPPAARRDVYTLSLENVASGRYTLQIVAYDPADPTTRFAWSTGADHLLLTDVNRPLTPNR